MTHHFLFLYSFNLCPLLVSPTCATSALDSEVVPHSVFIPVFPSRSNFVMVMEGSITALVHPTFSFFFIYLLIHLHSIRVLFHVSVCICTCHVSFHAIMVLFYHVPISGVTLNTPRLQQFVVLPFMLLPYASGSVVNFCACPEYIKLEDLRLGLTT